MTPQDIDLLQQSIGKVVRIRCSDGEIITAQLDTADSQDQEIIYEMLSTSDESKYEKHDRPI